MGTIDDLVRDLRGFDANAEVTKALRKELTKLVPTVKEEIKKNAIAILPKSGGLNEWVAATKVTVYTRLAGRTVRITLVGGRSSSTGKKSDIKRMDAGRLRHPSWGRRSRGNWHTQTVSEGFFTDPASEQAPWAMAAERAVDRALDVIRRG